MPRWILYAIVCALLAAGCRSAPAELQPSLTPAATDEPTSIPPTAAPTLTPTQVEPGELTYLAYHGGAAHGAWELDSVQLFMEANPGIDVALDRLDIYSSPVPTTVESRMAANVPPDVVSGFMAGVFLDYVDRGLIQDISDLWVQNGWYAAFPKSTIEMASVGGRQYFVPLAVQWHPVWYRTDTFQEFGLTPPRILGRPDGNLRDVERGQERRDDPRIAAVFERWSEAVAHDCFSEDVLSTTYPQPASQLYSGRAAMYLLGEWLAESFPAGLHQDIDFFRFPVIDPAVPNGEIAHFYGAFLHAGAEKPGRGRLFLTYLGSEEAQNSFAAVMGRISMHAAIDPSLFDDRYLRGIQIIQDSGTLTALFELGTHADLAEAGLATFKEFLRDPAGIDEDLAMMEELREKVYGPVP